MVYSFVAKLKSNGVGFDRAFFVTAIRDEPGIMNYGSDLLILSAYAPSMPPLLSLLLSMACDDSDGGAVKAVITRILAGQPFRLAAMAGLYSLTCIVPGISSHFNLNTSHAFAVAVSIATFSFTVMVTRMGYVAMMEYNYGLDPGYQPGGFSDGFRQEFWRANEGITNVPAKNLKARRYCKEKLIIFSTISPLTTFDLKPLILSLKLQRLQTLIISSRKCLRSQAYKTKVYDVEIIISARFLPECNVTRNIILRHILARALGSKVACAVSGWDIGVYHLPSKVEVLAWSAKTQVEMFKCGDHIIGVQGHPEYTHDILLHLIDHLLQTNLIEVSKETITKIMTIPPLIKVKEAPQRGHIGLSLFEMFFNGHRGTSLLKTHDIFHALKMNICKTFPVDENENVVEEYGVEDVLVHSNVVKEDSFENVLVHVDIMVEDDSVEDLLFHDDNVVEEETIKIIIYDDDNAV
ncbi:gamma-glutamyl peptidase 5-like protein [Tanacetum coccineum]